MTYGSYRITCFDVVSVGDYDKRYLQLMKVNLISIKIEPELYIFHFFFFVQVNNIDESAMNASSIAPIDDAVSVSTLNSTNDEQQSRLIIQYHFTQWKDMDVPSDSHSLLHLIHEVNEQTPPEQYPIVVHCT